MTDPLQCCNDQSYFSSSYSSDSSLIPSCFVDPLLGKLIWICLISNLRFSIAWRTSERHCGDCVCYHLDRLIFDAWPELLDFLSLCVMLYTRRSECLSFRNGLFARDLLGWSLGFWRCLQLSPSNNESVWSLYKVCAMNCSVNSGTLCPEWPDFDWYSEPPWFECPQRWS